jgi:hypothetical protein
MNYLKQLLKMVQTIDNDRVKHLKLDWKAYEVKDYVDGTVVFITELRPVLDVELRSPYY